MGAALSRRSVVAGALGVAGASALGTGLGRPGGGIAELAQLAAAQDENMLCEPLVLKSEHGLLSAELVASIDVDRGPGAIGYANGGLDCPAGTVGFGGLIPGPTLRVLPGDRLRIRLTNDLTEDTNLHVHGLHVSPLDHGDNVFVHVMQNHSFNFEYDIPVDHPTGLFWYHPHVHREANDQVNRGLAGAIVIAEDPDEEQDYTESLLAQGARYPGPPAEQRLLVFQHLDPPPPGELVQLYVNGQVKPTIEIGSGEQQRWQILNASANYFVNLFVDQHWLVRLAVDGNWIPNYAELAPLQVLAIGPAERAEVLITGTDAEVGETFAIRSLVRTAERDAPVFDQDVKPGAPPLTETPDELATLKIRPGTAAGTPHVPVTVAAVPCEPTGEEPDRIIRFTPALQIDGKSFSEGRVDQTVALGATELWEIVNLHDEGFGWHPFHLHVNDFDVLKTSDERLERSFYQDTIPLPPLTLIDPTAGNADPDNQRPGSVRFCSRFLHYTGRFVYHCHFLGHEDEGMMAVVEVVAPVQITGSGFPEALQVAAGPYVEGGVNSGTTVVWTNLDSTPHTVTADEIDSFNGTPIFDSGDLGCDLSFAHTFDSPGTVPYHCSRHPEEKGSIVVTATKTIELRGLPSGPAFEPTDIAVARGTTVSWTNRRSDPLTIVVTDLDAAGDDPLVVSNPLGLKGEFRHTFESGRFAYHSAADPVLGGTVSVAPVERQSVSIAITDDGFIPPEPKIRAGSTVTWTNRSSAPQTVTGDGGIGADALFDSGQLDAEVAFSAGRAINPGQRFSHPIGPGVTAFDYFSRLAMAGTITFSTIAPAGPARIEIIDGAFVPSAVTIRPGAGVIWKNSSDDTHTVSNADGLFDMQLNPTEEFPFRFEMGQVNPVAFFSKLAMRARIDVM